METSWLFADREFALLKVSTDSTGTGEFEVMLDGLKALTMTAHVYMDGVVVICA